jgi:signal transduction histidine kinase
MDTYVFVVDSTCTVLVNPLFPEQEGKNVYDYQDIRGKYFFREFFRVVNEKGSGWVDYYWPKPGDARPSSKTSFVKKIVVRKQPYLVGTGIYTE